MTNTEMDYLKLLGCRFILDNYASINGFLITKDTYYWSIRGNIPYMCAKQFRNKDIRFNGEFNEITLRSLNNDKYTRLGQDFLDNFIYEQPGYSLEKESLEKYIGTTKQDMLNDNPESFYVKLLHIDSNAGLEEVLHLISKNNLVMIW